MKVKSESEVAQLCPTLVTPWTVAHQAPPSMGFSRQEYWSGVPLPSPANSAQEFPFFHISANTFTVSYIRDNSHSNRHEVTIHCGFDFYFPDDY